MSQGVNSSLSVVKTVVGADPAAGAEVSVTVPTDKTWLLKSMTVLLVQGLTQTPQPFLVILDASSNIVYACYGSTSAQSASTTARYMWGVDLPAPGALIGSTPNILALAPLAQGLLLPAGYTIATTTFGIGANSNYGAPVLLVTEFG